MSAEKLQNIKSKETPMDQLLELMRTLRDPNGGCPWDVEQDFASIAKYTIEEAYEVADAIERDDMNDLKDELGDLLLQVVFHAQIAKDKGLFDFTDVAKHVTEKMVERHPHVFGDHIENSMEAYKVLDIWEAQKEKEKPRGSAMDGVTLGLPALMRAQKLQKRAARVGYDWKAMSPIIDKLDEEVVEFKEALDENDLEHIGEELGDIMFTCVNLARFLKMDAEEIMGKSNNKFERRFRGMEAIIKLQHKEIKDCSLDEMEAAWQAVKSKS